MTDPIVALDTLSVRYPEPNDAGADRYLTFAKVTTRDGVVGWGEAVTMLPGPSRATEALIASLAPLVVGRDPEDVEAIWSEISGGAWWYGYRGGILGFALSAIDIAIWDARGKQRGQALVDLLGGARRERIPALASTHAFDADLDAEAARHGRYVLEDGYRGVKVGFGKRGDARLGYDLDRDVDFIARLREAVGPDAWIMVDRGQSLPWSVDDALARVRAWEEQGLAWIEEPFEPEATEELARLRAGIRCLVAGAEREWDERGYREALAGGLLDVVGCDVGRAGGITGARRVLRIVEEHGLVFNSHAWSSAVNTAVSIALSAVAADVMVQELKPDRNPMQHELVATPFVVEDGHVAVPRVPGNGAEIDESVLERYRLD